jgi:hypothetical protein
LVIALLAVVAIPLSVHAYNGNTAANYADQWATQHNSNYPQFGSDCTNFVSQAMHTGGYSYVGNWGSTTNDRNWYVDYVWWAPWWPWQNSNSWSVASDLKQFLYLDLPGGFDWGTWQGNQYSGLSGVNQGDLLFFDWGQGLGISHVTMDVGFGQDPNSGMWGDYIDEHTSDRYHAFWTLQPYNAAASSTTIYKVHIDPGNY